jgi:YD repeat-containing protein
LSPLSGPLVLLSAGSLDESEQRRAAAEAQRNSPEAILRREESRTRFESETSGQAEQTDKTTFPAVINQSEGGPPRLQAGQKVIGFESGNVAQVDLGEGRGALIQSTSPMAFESSPKHWTASNLELHSDSNGFAPISPLVPVRLPRHLAEGAQLPSASVSLTPVDAAGAPLQGGEGAFEGASVFFANTQADSDTILKPSPLGVEASTVLRSAQAPEVLYYKIGMPAGASLEQEPGAPIVHVVKEGAVIATVGAPHASDATGTVVPTSMSLSGDTLVVAVQHRSGSFQYPIIVDPEFWQVWINYPTGNWEFHEWIGYKYGRNNSEIWMSHEGGYSPADYAAWSTWTKGYTQIYEVYVKDDVTPSEPFLEAWIDIFGPGEEEQTRLSHPPSDSTEATVCARPSCAPEAGIANGNHFGFELTTNRSGASGFWGSLTQVSMAIGEEKGLHSTINYNKSASELSSGKPPQNTPNVLFGTGSWMGPKSGAFEYTAEDGGLGIAETKVEYDGPSGWEHFGGTNYQSESGSYQSKSGCIGVQCESPQRETNTYLGLKGSSGKYLPDGEDKVRVAARSPEPYTTSSEYGEGEETLKVDAAPPYNIALTGLPSGSKGFELGEGEAHIKAEATDGSGSTKSSGIKSISLYVDKREVGTAAGACQPGPCTGDAEWAINGSELGVGEHTLVVRATDNAGNEETTKEYQLTVHAASPISIGPGSVNPESGDFALEATDANVSGGVGALTVSRHYDSRNTTEGGTGPLGPQWTIDLGSTAQLEILPDSSVMVIGPSGPAHFSIKAGGGFEAPSGDTNLTLEYSKEYEAKGPAYLLKDAARGTSTVFRHPEGVEAWVASVTKGPSATDAITYEYKTVDVEGKDIAEPTLELAPHPTITCEKEHMATGCRGLEFVYTESEGTAKGLAQSEWGSYRNRLKEIKAVVPTSKATEPIPVAAYEWDGKGRLRAEWDPRVSPALKTIMGYDEEGRVTAVTPPGQTPWLLTYGTAAGDASPGRLVKAWRPASAGSWNGKAPKLTAPINVSGSSVVGSTISVEHGAWENGPLTYGYQWERCVLLSCVPIVGATNPEYTFTAADLHHWLHADVTATNSGGTVVGTGVSEVVLEGTVKNGERRTESEGSTVEYQVPIAGRSGLPNMTATEVAKWSQKDVPVEATAIIPPYKEHTGWPALEYRAATVYYMDSKARTVNIANPFGGVSTQEFNEENEITRGLSADNRATALKEANSREASERLDTKSAYAEGVLTDTWGPQHAVKLAVGKKEADEEVQARSHVHYYYDERAPKGEEKYELVTKTTDGAETPSKEEFDVRTTLTGYAGQDGLGWELRKPTSTTVDPAGLDLVHETIYDKESGNATETRSPGGNSETIYPPAFASAFGSEGTGNGQFKQPSGVAVDSSGNLWVVDAGNNRLEKFSTSGSWLASYGKAGSGEAQFNEPRSIALNQSTGNVYVADKANNRIEELSATGAYVASLGTSGSGALKEPEGVALDSSGDVWVSDTGHNRLVEFSSAGTFIREAGSLGSGTGQLKSPAGLTISEGTVFVVDSANSRVEQFSSSGAYLGQVGTSGSGTGQFKEPWGIAANSSTGNLYVADRGNERIQEFSPAGRYLTSWGTWEPSHHLSSPVNLAVGATGTLYASDLSADKVSAWTPPEAGAAHLSYASQIGGSGSAPGQFSRPIASAIDGGGNIWVSDNGNNRVQEFSSKGSFIAAYGKEGSSESQVQFKGPGGIDVNQSTGNVYVSDLGNDRIVELSSSGSFIRTFGHANLSYPTGLKVDPSGNVWVADYNADKIVEFSASGTFIVAYGKEGSGEVQFKSPTAIAFSGENLYVSDTGNHRIEELSKAGAYLRSWGTVQGEGSGELDYPEGIAADAAGNLYVVDDGANHVEEFSSSGAYMATFATKGTGEGQLSAPVGDSIDAAGDMYVVDTGNNRVEKWTSNNPAVHYTKAIYYTAKTEAEVEACQNHAEWVGLLCQTRPAAQPTNSELPEVPRTTFRYNMWDQKTSVEEVFGSVTRTTTTTFEGNSERPLNTKETSSKDVALPEVAVKYNKENGTIEEQSDSDGEKLLSTTNQLGELETYTDADGNKAKLEYDAYGRLIEVKDGSEEGKGHQKYEYNETTGARTTLNDSGAGVFGATQDAEGGTASETYPNGMTAYYTRNSVGAATAIEYKKLTHCTEEKESCIWFKEKMVPSIHGESIETSSTLAEVNSSYDAAGNLTQVQETVPGEGCKTRLYTYDEDGNRTSQTEREPAAEGKCATEGGITHEHLYSADRLADPGVVDDAFGDTEELPAADAGGSELTSSFYVDGQVDKQKQSGEAVENLLDPEYRTRKTVFEGSKGSSVINHYDGPGDEITWSSESEGRWTRNVPGISGELAAVETSSSSVVLQLHDLKGNIVATAGVSETETKLRSKYNSSEFGVPTSKERPPTYAWLGATAMATDLPSGAITQDGSTYVPQTGRALQAEAPVLPLPENVANQPAASDGPEALEQAGRAAAQAYEQFLEALRAAAGAGQPGGEIPTVVGFESHLAGTGGSGAVESKILRWSTTVSPATARTWGYALTVLGTPLGEHGVEFAGMPGWLTKIAEAASRVELIKTGNNLIVAGSLPDCEAVRIEAWGSFKLGFFVEVSAYLGG